MTSVIIAGLIGGAIKTIFFAGVLFALLLVVILYMIFRKKN